jgi:hypothetical protein
MVLTSMAQRDRDKAKTGSETEEEDTSSEDIALLFCFPFMIFAVLVVFQLEKVLRDSAYTYDDPKAIPKEFCTYEEWCKGCDGTGNCPKGEACAICLSDFDETDEVRGLLVCGHVFHRSCVEGWFSMQEQEQFAVKFCPLCRAPVMSAFQFRAQIRMQNQSRERSRPSWRPGQAEPDASPEAMQEEGRAVTADLMVVA